MKRRRENHKIIMLVLTMYCCSMLLLLTSCQQRQQESSEIAEEVVIPVSFLINPDTGENENEDLVKAFNKEYEGKYRVEVEWITDDAEGYRSRIKMLNGLDRLPAIITDVGFDADFYQLLISHDRLVNLAPYIEQDEAWQKVFKERELKTCMEEDGSLYLAPSGNTSYSYAGFYYNKELFAQAGIEKFPETWEEFFNCLDTLKAQGITPLAIHGGSSYWTPLLIATNYMAITDSGMNFLQIQYPADYKNDSVRDMFSMLKRMYDYADEDALQIEREESARRFSEGENAITSNGGWMISNFTDEVKARTGFAPFPGNVMMEDLKMSAWSAAAGYAKEVVDGAVEFLKFRTLMDYQKKADEARSNDWSTVEMEYWRAVAQTGRITPNYQLKWETGIQEDFIVSVLPSYVEGQIGLEEFLDRLNAAVAVINDEK